MKLRGDRCRCSACGEYFTTTGTFDKHRKGQHVARRCLAVEELLSAGWGKNKHGFWMRPGKPRIAGAYDYRSGDRRRPATEVSL